MRKIFVPIIFIIIVICFSFYIVHLIGWSRIFSPGLLSKAHKDFDQSYECNVCHTKGNKIDNRKCLGCHEEINDRINAGSGLHARISKECSECHSEHHGRDYNPIHFDKETFSHDTSGWKLEGIHTLLRCKFCHVKGTYLLNKTQCVYCHKDVHEGENGEDCAECHNQDSFIIE